MLEGKLYKEILLNFGNVYLDNYDFYRYGNRSYKSTIALHLYKWLSKFGVAYFATGKFDFKNRVLKLSDQINNLTYLFDNLSDEPSKQLLIQLMTYRVLGNTRYKLKLGMPDYFDSIAKVKKLRIGRDEVVTKGMAGNISMRKYDLSSIGYEIKMYLHEKGLVSDFIWKQYEYHKENVHIHAKPGDVVIDAGGCYGDTALYFAATVGNTGVVYSYEFIPHNVELFHKNLELNQNVVKQIKLIQHPLWDSDNVNIYYKDSGPGSRVSLDPFKNSETILTKTIDSTVKIEGLNRVDFIKMDIEGAELKAIDGAVETIKKYKPTLAISVYHSLTDFGDIPRKIKSLNPTYKLFLGHYTIHAEETILFAIDEAR